MLAVMAYSLSVVDVALLVGPTQPPTFAVVVWQWFNEPDLTYLPRAAAGAVVLFLMACISALFVRVVDYCICQLWRGWQFSGRVQLKLPGKSLFSGILVISILMIPVMLLWSVALRWRFPDLLPSRYSLRFWTLEWSSLWQTISQSLYIALLSATIALVLALIAHEYRIRHRWSMPHLVIALPMLIPQLSLLLGLQVATLYVDDNAYFLWVCWSHILFAFPFVYLTLDGPWQSYNFKLTQVALSLGKSPIIAWFQVKMPVLLPAIVFAWAVGISVSLAQYLPTLMLGGGRISTVTTEAVALSSGFDRRVVAIYAIWQTLMPLPFFLFAFILNRRLSKQHRLVSKGLANDATS